MHTDEYEISIAREINICKRVIRKITARLQEREKRFGITTTEISIGLQQSLVRGSNLMKWQEDIEALSQWEQRLNEYARALNEMRVSSIGQ